MEIIKKDLTGIEIKAIEGLTTILNDVEIKEDSNKKEFLNPFDEGVTYEAFLKSIPKGKTVAEHLNKRVTAEELEFIEKELSILK